MNKSWNPIEKPLFPWVSTIERILCAADVPAMTGDIINIFSDYSGDYKGSKYDTLSFLYFDLQNSVEWESQRRIIREQFLADGRRMSFKKLGDRHRRRALIPFLQAADQISGVCVVFAIRKTIRNLCTNAICFAKSTFISNSFI